ncbi:MAG: citramalate synthase [Parvularculales bacterium]
MAKERLYLLDTTLRDGALTRGVDFSVDDKYRIAEILDELGLDYVEGGWPGANPTDTAFFSKPPALSHAQFTAFGMTRRPGRSASNDTGLAALLEPQTDAVCIVAKSWDFHVEVVLETTHEENLAAIADSVEVACARGREVMVDAEHFFDGYKSNPDYALACLKAAIDNGARWVVLCDTNGGTLPGEVSRIVSEVATMIPGERLGIHAHNDTENAVANTLAAVKSGVRHIQGTLNGLGERCGNANLCSIIPTLLLKPEFSDYFETGVSMKGLQSLRRVSFVLDEILNRAPDSHAPYVGDAAFSHKAGLHGSAVQKDPRTYEHVPPEMIGNKRHVLVSNQSGRANIARRLASVGLEVSADDSCIQNLLEIVKEREFMGYSYDGAEASFEVLARQIMGEIPEYFVVESFRVMSERRHNALGKLVNAVEATVKVTVDGEALLSVAEGNGPVNALDNALRKDLGKYSSYISDMRLVDFKVRILTRTGTDAVTRVVIESADDKDNHWFTVGISENIVDASFQALLDSIVYKLFHAGAPLPGGGRSI